MGVPEKSFEPRAACPLDGARVVDMSRLVSGNMVSLQLADFGAEVIKSEALSLREPRGRELFLDLLASAQVLIENFRPGTLETMGLGPELLHRRNPRLIILRVYGWGQDGPYRDRPGFGTLVESMSGYASRTGFTDREPALPPTALADMVAGLYGAFAVMVALREVETKGSAGQVIDLPLLDPLFSFIATEAAIYRLTDTVRERTGSRSETTSPRNVFRTKDGRYIGISASIQAMAERLFRAIGREDSPTRGSAPTPTGSGTPRPARGRSPPSSRHAHWLRTWRSSSAPRSPPRRSTTSTSLWPTHTSSGARSSSTCPTSRPAACRCTTSSRACPTHPAGCAVLRRHWVSIPPRSSARSASGRPISTDSRAKALSISGVIAHESAALAGVAFAFVCAGHCQALCRWRRKARGRCDHPRPRRQRRSVGEGTGAHLGGRSRRDRFARRRRRCRAHQPAVAHGGARHRGGGRPARRGAGLAQSGRPRACAAARRDRRRGRSRARHGTRGDPVYCHGRDRGGVLPHRRDRPCPPAALRAQSRRRGFRAVGRHPARSRGPLHAEADGGVRRPRRRHHAAGLYRHSRRIPRPRRLPADDPALAAALLHRRLGHPSEPGADPQRGVPRQPRGDRTCPPRRRRL